MSLCLTVDGGRDFRSDLNSWRIDGNFFIQFFPSDLGLTGCTIEPIITTQYPIMFGGGNVNSFIAFTNVFVSGLYLKVVAATRILTTNVSHNFLPLFAVRFDHVTVSLIGNKVGGFMAGSIVDELVAISMQQIIVESQFERRRHNVTSATAFELETDRWKPESHVVDNLSLRENVMDSFDRFALQFSHASTIAPCSARAREKEKKVCA